jgi:hypothetical protein
MIGQKTRTVDRSVTTAIAVLFLAVLPGRQSGRRAQRPSAPHRANILTTFAQRPSLAPNLVGDPAANAKKAL